MKILKNLRNDLVRLRNLSTEKTGNLRNSPVLEKTHRFLYSDTELFKKELCIYFLDTYQSYKQRNLKVLFTYYFCCFLPRGFEFNEEWGEGLGF